jgi:hypothetical protein
MGELERLFMAPKVNIKFASTPVNWSRKGICAAVASAATPAYVGPTTALLSGLPCLFPTPSVANPYFGWPLSCNAARTANRR